MLGGASFAMRADWDCAEVERRLLSKAEKVKSGCWEWLGSERRRGRGYGQMKIAQKSYFAHRVSYEIFCGPIDDGKFVCHRCDNPKCVNPDHLFLGTHQDNVDDQVAKGRQVKGTVNGRAKLTEDDVLAIRAAEGVLQKDLAAQFGISRQQVSNIRNGILWADIPKVYPNFQAVNQ